MGKCEPLGTFGSRFTQTFDFAPRLPSQSLESLPFSVYVLLLQISVGICVLKTNTDAELSRNSYFASPVVYNFGVIQWAWKGKCITDMLHVLQWECENKRNTKPLSLLMQDMRRQRTLQKRRPWLIRKMLDWFTSTSPSSQSSAAIESGKETVHVLTSEMLHNFFSNWLLLTTSLLIGLHLEGSFEFWNLNINIITNVFA